MSHKKKPLLKKKMKEHIKDEVKMGKKVVKEDKPMISKMKGKC